MEEESGDVSALAGGAPALVGFLDHAPVVLGDPRSGEGRDRRRGEVGPRGREGGLLRGLDADERVARSARDLSGDITPVPVELRARHHLVEQPQRECGLGVEHTAGRHERQRASATQQRSEPLDAAPCRHDPERHLVERALHVVGGDPDVARHRNLGASAVGVAVDGRDHRNGQRRQPVEHTAHGLGHGGRVLVCADRGELLEVATGDEHAGAGAGDHQDPGR